MSAQYDGIATEYQRTKESPIRTYVETFSFMRMVGSVAGLRVLDLACGEGFYTRRLRAAGATGVTGVDISLDMIALALAEEQRNPLGIAYCCADVAELKSAGGFDLATAAYLLHYAPDSSALHRMCENIAACLRPGGRLVALNENPQQPEDSGAAYTQYGFNKQFAVPRTNGSAIEYSMVAGRKMIRFTAWYYSREVYEQALAAAGFREVRWLPLQLSPDGIAAHGAEYWQGYLENPPLVGLEASL